MYFSSCNFPDIQLFPIFETIIVFLENSLFGVFCWRVDGTSMLTNELETVSCLYEDCVHLREKSLETIKYILCKCLSDEK